MNKTISGKDHKWSVLIHQMPPKPTSCRVKVWRKLQKIGAVPIKNSVYIIPFTKEAHEDFQWLRQEIIAQKGDATIFKVDSIEGINDREIIERFRNARSKDYDKIISKSLKFKRDLEGNKERPISITQKEKYESEFRKNKVLLNGIVSLDYFRAPNREKAEKTITNCKELIENLKVAEGKTQLVEEDRPIKIHNKNEFQNKTWITRKGLHIDRIASGWLIKRFIDKGAKLFFISENGIVKNGIGFDVYNTEFTHRGEDCTFETLLKSFDLKDPILVEIAEIVHDIDLKDRKFDRLEAEGINQIIVGLSQKLKDDKELFKSGMEIFDALYQYYNLKKPKGR